MNILKITKSILNKKRSLNKTTPAFTILEMLLVIAIIAILAGIVIIAINPGRQLAQARNAQRASDLRALNSAVQQYYVDNRRYPDALTSELQEVCAETGASGCVDIVNDLVPTYLSAIPQDPQASGTSTAYKIAINPTSLMPELTAPNSTEYSLTPIQLGTTTLSSSGTESWACGDLLSYEGQDYATVEIGEQCWMQQNLNVGTMITGTTNMTNNSTLEKYCYNNDESNCTTYGALYQWDEAMQYVTTAGAKGICPTGWHIPTHDEFTTLERSICTSGTCATDFPYDTITNNSWRGTNEGTTMKNTAGVWKGLLTGYRSTTGTFADIGVTTHYWSSLQSSTHAWRRYLNSGYATVLRSTNTKTGGFSLRCLKD